MQDTSGATAHLNAIINELQYQNTHLKKENQTLKGELTRLKASLQDNNTDTQVLEQEISTLRSSLHRLQEELEEKEKSIVEINADIDRFNEEFDKILSHFEMATEQNSNTDQAAAEFLDSDTLGQNTDLMFGINIDESFLHTSKAETVKYYLYATGAYHGTTFEIDNLKINSRSELAMIGKALSLYFQIKSQDEDNDFIGLLEMTPTNVFNQIVVQFWGTDPHLARELFGSFSKQYNLFGEIDYNLESVEG